MCPLRATFIGAAGDTEASVLKNSAVASGPLAPSPPVIRMRPSESRTADEFARASFRFAVGAHVPLGTSSADPLSTSTAQRKMAMQRSEVLAAFRIRDLGRQNSAFNTQATLRPGSGDSCAA